MADWNPKANQIFLDALEIDSNEAVEQLREANRIYSESPSEDNCPANMWYFLAMSYQKLGDRAAARKWFDKASAYTE